jgi:hypothetical protein
MVHVPTARRPETTVVQFPRERVVFAGRLPGIGSVPFSFGEDGPADAFAWMETLRPIEFDLLMVGDGRTVSRAEFDALWTYLSTLRAAVAAGIDDGRSLSDIQSAAALDRLRTSPHYAARASQVSGLYAAQQSWVVRFSAGAAASYARLSSAFCASQTSCSGAGGAPAARFTLSFAPPKDFDVLGEVTVGGRTWSARSSGDVGQEAVRRRSRGTLLFRRKSEFSGLSYALAAGPSLTLDAVQGMTRVNGALAPTGGYHPFEEHTSRVGLTFGADLEHRLSRGVAIRLPLRVTWSAAGAAEQFVDSGFDVHVGLDVTFRLFHRVWFR